MKSMMRFGKKGKLIPRDIGPYWIMLRIDQVSYKLELPPKLGAVHQVFYVSMLRKCLGDPSRVTPIEYIQITENLTCEEILVAIPDHQVVN